MSRPRSVGLVFYFVLFVPFCGYLHQAGGVFRRGFD